MSWERDYYTNGRPYATGTNLFKPGVIEFGSADEDLGITFATAVKGLGFRVAEDVVIEGVEVRIDDLLANQQLEHGPLVDA